MTLVPDAPGQLTSDHGWDLSGDTTNLEKIITRLKNNGIRVSLFLDPVVDYVCNEYLLRECPGALRAHETRSGNSGKVDG